MTVYLKMAKNILHSVGDTGVRKRYDAFLHLSSDVESLTSSFLHRLQSFSIVAKEPSQGNPGSWPRAQLFSERDVEKSLSLTYRGRGKLERSCQPSPLSKAANSSSPSAHVKGIGTSSVATPVAALEPLIQHLEELLCSLTVRVLNHSAQELALLGGDLAYLERFLRLGMKQLTLEEVGAILSNRGQHSSEVIQAVGVEAERELSAHLGGLPFLVIYKPCHVSALSSSVQLPKGYSFACADLVFPKLGMGSYAAAYGTFDYRSPAKRLLNGILPYPLLPRTRGASKGVITVSVSLNHLLGFLLQTKLFFRGGVGRPKIERKWPFGEEQEPKSKQR